MNITKNQIDDLNATIKIELGKEDYAGRVEKALKDYQKKVVVNGFRPGKTPMGIVKKMYGKSLLVDEINKVLGESLNNYIKENNLQILGEPLPNETEQKELNLEDENFEFLYDIALSPEVNAKMSKREKIPPSFTFPSASNSINSPFRYSVPSISSTAIMLPLFLQILSICLSIISSSTLMV